MYRKGAYCMHLIRHGRNHGADAPLSRTSLKTSPGGTGTKRRSEIISSWEVGLASRLMPMVRHRTNGKVSRATRKEGLNVMRKLNYCWTAIRPIIAALVVSLSIWAAVGLVAYLLFR